MSTARYAVAFLSTSLLTGCATVTPVGIDWSGVPAEIGQAPVKVLVYGPTDPVQVFTPGQVLGAGLIDSLTRPDGSSLSIPNPAYLVGLSLRQQLANAGRLRLGDIPNEIVAEKPPRDGYAPGESVFEVVADLSALDYQRLAWATYNYALDAHARLVAPDGKLLWQNKCTVRNGADNQLALKRNEFAKDDGQKLKAILQLAAEQCATQIVP